MVAGLFLFLLLLLIPNFCRAATRHYYIAAEDVMWDYAPSGQNLLAGSTLGAPWWSGTRWKKSRYIEYTDSSFTVRKPQPEWLGILGPIIRAEVGDAVEVEFLNRTQAAHSIHPHGLRYDKANEGSFYLPMAAGARVPPGGRFTYHWFADKNSGPGPGQPSSIVWWYHAHVDPGIEMNEGLLGAIIVTAKGKAKPDGTPKDVDREFVTSFMIFNELQGKPAGMFYAINGLIFGNLPGLVMKQGERVRWYLMGMGNEIDLHTPHWHGETVVEDKRHVDVVELLPGSTRTVDMVADNPGVWMFHCHVEEHMESGMVTTYTIYRPGNRSCPLKVDKGDFWNPANAQKFLLEIENESDKAIRSVLLGSNVLLTPNYLRQPYTDSEWRGDAAVAPHATETLAGTAYLKSYRDKIMAWIFFPKRITYADGSVWTPEQDRECFQAVWRDGTHPVLETLPVVQMETKED